MDSITPWSTLWLQEGKTLHTLQQQQWSGNLHHSIIVQRLTGESWDPPTKVVVLFLFLCSPHALFSHRWRSGVERVIEHRAQCLSCPRPHTCTDRHILVIQFASFRVTRGVNELLALSRWGLRDSERSLKFGFKGVHELHKRTIKSWGNNECRALNELANIFAVVALLNGIRLAFRDKFKWQSPH